MKIKLTLVASGLALIIAISGITGCASVVRGTSEQISFDSNPPGAVVRTAIDLSCDGKPCPTSQDEGRYSGIGSSGAGDMTGLIQSGPACTTPCVMTFSRNARISATFVKEGYEPETIKILPEIGANGAVGIAGNILLGGAVGAVVDAGTGAAMDHHPNPAIVNLRPGVGAPIRRP